MLENVYKLDGKYPDPHEIEDRLVQLRKEPNHEREFKQFLSELKNSGLSSHPLLNRFFVES